MNKQRIILEDSILEVYSPWGILDSILEDSNLLFE